MSDPYIGQIMAVGFSFAPVGWLLCDGSLISIAEHEVLFTLIGTTYGGDGQTTFGLPDLRGRTPVGAGQGPGLSPRVIGEMSGTNDVTLTAQQVGAHNHIMRASAAQGTTNTPGTAVALANNAQPAAFLYCSYPTTFSMSPGAVVPFGGSMPHENRQPLQAVTYIICAYGVYPPRS